MTPTIAIGSEARRQEGAANTERLRVAAPPQAIPSGDHLTSESHVATATELNFAPSRPAHVRRGDRAQLLRLVVADCISVVLALNIVFFDHRGSTRAIFATAVGLLFALIICRFAGTYDVRRTRLSASTLDEIPALWVASGLLTVVMAITIPDLVGMNLGGSQLALTWISLLAALVLGRCLSRATGRGPDMVERCVVVGDASQTDRIRERFRAHGVSASVVAAVSLTRETMLESEASLEEILRTVCTEEGAQRLIVAPGSDALDQLPKLIRIAKSAGVAVSMLPAGIDTVGHALDFEDVNGMTLVGIGQYGLSPVSVLLKRTLDVSAGLLLLLLLSPVLLVLTVAVRLDSRGPALFRQTRIGRDGRPFQILKLRSMVVDADAHKDDLRSLGDLGDGLFKIADDPRVTRLGRFLRRSSLDELPQILNVLKGEMSLVGPRPLVPEEDEAILRVHRDRRLYLMPGMTGPWQVLRERVPLHEMVDIDYRYAAGWSMWRDLKIMIRTALHVVRRRNV